MVRRSTRLSSRNSSTPKRVSLSHDGIKTPNTVPAKLAALQEVNEMPDISPHRINPVATTKTARKSLAETPSKATPIKPSSQEMHPQHHQQSTAKPRDEARYLGFSNMGSYTAPPKQMGVSANIQSTPSKSNGLGVEKSSSTFQFTFRREHSLELSPQAKKLMYEKREEAAKIRQQMTADGQGPESVDSLLERKIAVPKSQKGRFSQVHQSQFDKMDSIAGHASAFRAHSNHSTPRSSASQIKSRSLSTNTTPKSPKRSLSKAGLDEPEQSSSQSIPRIAGNSTTSPLKSHHNQPSRQQMSNPSTTVHPATVKRVKIVGSEDAPAAKRQARREEDERRTTPTTPRSIKIPSITSTKKGLKTPTQASLARSPGTGSFQASKIPGPACVSINTTDRVNAQEATGSREPESPFLSRSPMKTALFGKSSTTEAQLPPAASALFSRTPLKGGTLKNQLSVGEVHVEQTKAAVPLFARSPTRPFTLRRSGDDGNEIGEQAFPPVPLLAQSPLKGVFVKADENEEAQNKGASIPLFAKSPSKFNMPTLNDAGQTSHSPSQSKTPGHRHLLQVSPIKSILRTPQRLYSADPAKVAAGTHLATPPPQRSVSDLTSNLIPSTAARKRVDFTSSTKAGEESSTPNSKYKSPSSKMSHKGAETPSTSVIEYPTLPTVFTPPSPSPQKRRMTGGPNDFTFRAGGQEIVFGTSPKALSTVGSAQRQPTIRHVSSNLAIVSTSVAGSKKRKFDFENTTASAATEENASDKENTPASNNNEEEHRPVKRTKIAPVADKPQTTVAAKKKIVSRMPTLGVKPKKDSNETKKRTTTISQSRLNALAQPKRRG